MFKKITAMLLLLALCFCTVSCAAGEEAEAPEGMKLASKAGEPFRLYVPDSWTENVKSGISSACLYYTVDIVSTMVSARFYTRTDLSETLADQINKKVTAYTESVPDFKQLDITNTVLSDQPAIRLDYTATLGSTNRRCSEIVAFYEGDVVSLHWYVIDSQYESMQPTLKQIEDAFVLCEKTVPNQVITDKHTPEGMKIASDEDIEYRLYVPLTWICDPSGGRSEAYVESDRSNVTVTSFSPTAGFSTALDYFTALETSYSKNIAGYERLSHSDRSVAGRDATSFTYKAAYDGVEYRIRETILSYNSVVYSITYTAKADCFDAHLADADRILDAFRFR